MSREIAKNPTEPDFEYDSEEGIFNPIEFVQKIGRRRIPALVIVMHIFFIFYMVWKKLFHLPQQVLRHVRIYILIQDATLS